MASELGQIIESVRRRRGLSLRGLAREIGKSATLLSMLEGNDRAPPVAEETLRRIAEVLGIEADHLVTLAGKTPEDVVPEDALEVAIYRLVKKLSLKRKKLLLRQLQNQL